MKDILSFREMEQHYDKWGPHGGPHGVDVVLVLDYVAPPSTGAPMGRPRWEEGM